MKGRVERGEKRGGKTGGRRQRGNLPFKSSLGPESQESPAPQRSLLFTAPKAGAQTCARPGPISTARPHLDLERGKDKNQRRTPRTRPEERSAGEGSQSGDGGYGGWDSSSPRRRRVRAAQLGWWPRRRCRRAAGRGAASSPTLAASSSLLLPPPSLAPAPAGRGQARGALRGLLQRREVGRHAKCVARGDAGGPTGSPLPRTAASAFPTPRSAASQPARSPGRGLTSASPWSRQLIDD